MKKGAYDLGRKAVYYIVVLVIIAFLFVYMTNNFRKYQITRLSNLDELTNLVMLKNIERCVSKIDPDTGMLELYIIDENRLNKESLIECLGKRSPYTDKAIKLEITGKIIETQEPYFDYTKYERSVTYKGESKELEISIENYPRLG